MTNSKNDAYQQKILQLLLREQAADALKQATVRQNTVLKEQIGAIKQKYEEKIQQLKQSAENDLSRAQMEIRLAKMSKIEETQKNQELQNQIVEQNNLLNEITQKKLKVQEELKKLKKDFDECKSQLTKRLQTCNNYEQKCLRYQQNNRQLNQQNLLRQTQTDQLIKSKANLSKLNSKLMSEVNELRQLLDDSNKKLQLLKNQDQIKTKAKLQKQEEFIRYESKIQQISRQNSILRDRKKKTQDDLKALEDDKEQLQETVKRAEKLAKKNKDIIGEHQSRIKQLEEQNSLHIEKYRNLDRNFKSAKRQIEQLQQSLQSVEQSKSSQFTKYKKWETITKAQKETLIQKEEELQELAQVLNGVKKDFQTLQRSNFEMTMQLQKLTKENKYLSEQYQQQQQKRIILQSEKDKSLSIIVREKDVLNKANFKLLQLLELKDKVLVSIVQAVEKQSDKIDITTVLQGEQLLKEIRQSDRQKLKNSKQRIKFLEEWIKARK